MNFSYAIKKLKLGNAVYRKSHSLGAQIKLVTQDFILKLIDVKLRKSIKLTKDHSFTPYFIMYLTETNTTITGWMPSVDDLLAEDWKLLK